MQILMVLVFVVPAALYLAAWRGSDRLATPLLIAALALHAGSLYLAVSSADGWRFGFASILSATLWVGVVVVWLEALSVGLRALRVLLLPVAALAVLLPLAFPGAELGARATRPLFVPHLITGTLAYGVLALAALHAGLMAAAERALHHGAESRRAWIARLLDDLPPLLALERILFRLITVGFLFLTLTAVSGVFFSEQVFGKPLTLDHKTIFTLISWLVFGVLLLGRAQRGWRGKTALRLTFGGFALLLLAYVGSRFVLEVVLRRG
jgi:ABC-type uncharacterized transport system permease subunit